tara:strand:- start:59 stop:475 length:417 start_codon:yes stop_codon:yes gene_type:complete
MSNQLNLESWKQLIGKLILSCTRVEYELFRLYKNWLPNRQFYDDTYEDKYNKSIGITKEKVGEHNELLEELIEMKKIAKYRHLVAHNPVHYCNKTSSWKIFDLKKEELSIDINDLKDITNRAESLSILLSKNLRIIIK